MESDKKHGVPKGIECFGNAFFVVEFARQQQVLLQVVGGAVKFAHDGEQVADQPAGDGGALFVAKFVAKREVALKVLHGFIVIALFLPDGADTADADGHQQFVAEFFGEGQPLLKAQQGAVQTAFFQINDAEVGVQGCQPGFVCSAVRNLQALNQRMPSL